MATRAVLQTFEKYQKERVSFVTTVAEMAKNPQVRLLSELGESSPPTSWAARFVARRTSRLCRTPAPWPCCALCSSITCPGGGASAFVSLPAAADQTTCARAQRPAIGRSRPREARELQRRPGRGRGAERDPSAARECSLLDLVSTLALTCSPLRGRCTP